MLISLYIFVTFFVIYIIIPFIFIFYYTDSIISKNLNYTLWYVFLLYYGITVLIIFLQNYLYSSYFFFKSDCSVDLASYFINTLLPLSVISVILFSERLLDLKLYKVFSNTYGILLYTSESLNIFTNKQNNSGQPISDNGLLLIKFYANPILLVQELDYDNLRTELNNYQIDIEEENVIELKKILIKHKLIGYFIFLFFICYITSLLSINLVLSQDCGPIYS